MIVTIDTNVLFQAFYSRAGASYQIVRMVRFGELEMAISVPVFQEYRDVISRPENKTFLGLDNSDIDTIMDFVATVGRVTHISYSWRPNLRDEADNMIIKLARASGSEYVITRNVKDMTIGSDMKNDDIQVVTPGDFLARWRKRWDKNRETH
jgi:putative PIN family toxin of toxin-antitoxin system